VGQVFNLAKKRAADMLQFRLRTLFIATTAVAVLAWALFAPPQWLGLWAIYLVYMLVPSAVVAGIVFQRGYWQAFFVGMAPSVVLVFFWIISNVFPSYPPWPLNESPWTADPDQLLVDKVLHTLALGLAVASGLVGVGIRWWALHVQRRSE
jgi:hypothetical protein